MPKLKQSAQAHTFMTSEQYEEVIRELLGALEICLECEGRISGETQRDAEILIERYKHLK